MDCWIQTNVLKSKNLWQYQFLKIAVGNILRTLWKGKEQNSGSFLEVNTKWRFIRLKMKRVIGIDCCGLLK